MGDHSAHVPVFHAMQFFYFTSLLCLFNPIETMYGILSLKQSISLKNIFFSILCCFLTWMAVRNFTYEHLYLISDNRHYMFYIWNKFFKGRLLFREILSPVYVLSVYIVFSRFLGRY